MITFDTPTLVTITAPTCSGKNYLRDAIEKKFGWDRLISTTTREMRSGEVNGVDYWFISREHSIAMEKGDEFAELVEFRGTRYGVTHVEMRNKLDQRVPPMVILEPQGVSLYKKMCAAEGWNIFTIYINTVEEERIKRLNFRSCADIQAIACENYDQTCREVGSILTRGNAFAQFEKVMKSHTDRILSITTEERRWMQTNIWDAIVPGDNVKKALEMIEQGVAYHNHKNKRPVPYTHVANECHEV